MGNWQQVLKKSVTTVDQLIELFGEEHIDREAVQQAIDKFNLRITPAALASIKEVGDASWLQYVPTAEENEILDGVIDSLNEDDDSPVPNITHRYPDRVLFLVSPVCATYCRFCTRRRKVGDPEKIPLNQFESAFQYLSDHTEIRDVIMSGGDPLMVPDREAGVLPAPVAGDPPHRDHSYPHAHPRASAGASDRRTFQDDLEVSSGVHQRPLQPSDRAHIQDGGLPGSTGQRRLSARFTDSPAERCQR